MSNKKLKKQNKNYKDLPLVRSFLKSFVLQGKTLIFPYRDENDKIQEERFHIKSYLFDNLFLIHKAGKDQLISLFFSNEKVKDELKQKISTLNMDRHLEHIIKGIKGSASTPLEYGLFLLEHYGDKPFSLIKEEETARGRIKSYMVASVEITVSSYRCAIDDYAVDISISGVPIDAFIATGNTPKTIEKLRHLTDSQGKIPLPFDRGKFRNYLRKSTPLYRASFSRQIASITRQSDHPEIRNSPLESSIPNRKTMYFWPYYTNRTIRINEIGVS
mgnify:CR=1 FL=1